MDVLMKKALIVYKSFLIDLDSFVFASVKMCLDFLSCALKATAKHRAKTKKSIELRVTE